MARTKYPAKDGYKVCNVCLEEKPLSEFYFKKQGRFQYYDPKCNSCARAYSKKWYKKNPKQSYDAHRRWLAKNKESQADYQWRYHVRTTYGLSNEQAEELFVNPRCGICGTENPGKGSKRFCVDHCHKTNKVRGLLCHECNRALERIEKIPDWGEKAKAYLATPVSLYGIAYHQNKSTTGEWIGLSRHTASSQG